ncbi:MAG: hypothetical protein AAGJ55_04970 [Cyanobacteria bacterium J06555_12]
MLEELLKKCPPLKARSYRLNRHDDYILCDAVSCLPPHPSSNVMIPFLFLSPVAIGILLMKLVSPQVGLLTCAALLVAASIYALASFKGELPG